MPIYEYEPDERNCLMCEGRIDVTQCCAFSATEGADVGLNTGTPVSEDYVNPFSFNGKIARVTIDLLDGHDGTVGFEADGISYSKTHANSP